MLSWRAHMRRGRKRRIFAEARMILPIRIYGDPILRAETREVRADSKDLQQLISDMLETMSGASGIGLAAPQVGRTERLFLMDLSSFLDELEPEERNRMPPQPMVFINPVILWESVAAEEFEEGCLSIPDIRELVERPESVQIAYRDRAFKEQKLKADNLLARVVQHEYDHLDGVLFIDHITAFRRGLLRRRLRDMARGEVEAEYLIAAAD